MFKKAVDWLARMLTAIIITLFIFAVTAVTLVYFYVVGYRCGDRGWHTMFYRGDVFGGYICPAPKVAIPSTFKQPEEGKEYQL